MSNEISWPTNPDERQARRWKRLGVGFSFLFSINFFVCLFLSKYYPTSDALRSIVSFVENIYPAINCFSYSALDRDSALICGSISFIASIASLPVMLSIGPRVSKIPILNSSQKRSFIFFVIPLHIFLLSNALFYRNTPGSSSRFSAIFRLFAESNWGSVFIGSTIFIIFSYLFWILFLTSFVLIRSLNRRG